MVLRVADQRQNANGSKAVGASANHGSIVGA